MQKTLWGSTDNSFFYATKKLRTVETRTRLKEQPSWLMPNSYFLENNQLYRFSVDKKLIPVSLDSSSDKYQRIFALTQIKTTIHHLLDASKKNSPKEVTRFLMTLNHLYDNFIKRFGYINEAINQKAYYEDPDLVTLLAIEDWDDRAQVATKRDIFYKAIVDPCKPLPTATSNAMAALTTSLHTFGRVNKEFIQKIYPRSEEVILKELEGILYRDPANNDQWVHAYNYLQGNIRKKLGYARRNPSKYRLNIEALTNILPRDLNADEIFVQLGSPWVSPELIMEFVNEEIWGKVDKYNGYVYIDYIPEVAKWVVDDSNASFIRLNRMDRYTWGTLAKPSMDILRDCLNQKQSICYDYSIDEKTGKNIRKVNYQATSAAKNKQERWQNAFRQWIWRDETRKQKLLRKYNDDFNSIVPNDFIPPSHYENYKFEGMRNSIKLDPHQLGAVYGIINNKTFGIYHVVGAGKTISNSSSNMELKRLGLIKTGWHVVKNSTLFDYAKEFAFLYPGARILIIQSADLPSILPTAVKFNWDAIITTHHAFKKIKTKHSTKVAQYKETLESLQNSYHLYKNSYTLSEIDAQIKKLVRKVYPKGFREKEQNCLYWEDIGENIGLFVDEAQAYKNLEIQSKLNISGLVRGTTNLGSMANDMFIKVQHLLKGNSRLILSTGTPLTNSPAELYTNQRFLQYGLLKKLGLSHFDAWVAMFGKVVSALELKPSGTGFHFKDRLSEYDNLTALKRLWFSSCDIKIDREKLGLKVPQASYHTIVAQPTKEFKDYMLELADRADRLPNEDEIIFNIIIDGTKASLFLPLVKPSLLRRDSNGLIIVDDNSKIGLACKKIAEIYHSKKEQKLTQMVFIDLSTPNAKADFTVYDIMRDWLVYKYNVVPNEIKFAQDFKKDKHKLFNQVNEGKVRIVFGSTEVMGVGVNAQRLLFALHHIDVGYTPNRLFQREGRIIRRGNLNQHIEIYRYVTEGGFDGFRWGLIQQKIKPLLQIMDDRIYTQSIKVFEEALINASQVKALTMGDDTILRYSEINAKVVRLTGLLSEHRDSLNIAKMKIQNNFEVIRSNNKLLELYKPVVLGFNSNPEIAGEFGEKLYEKSQSLVYVTSDVVLGNLYDIVRVVLFTDYFTQKLKVRLEINDFFWDFLLRIGKDNQETNKKQIYRFFESLLKECKSLSELNETLSNQVKELSPVLNNNFQYTEELEQAKKELMEIEKKLNSINEDNVV